MILKEILATTSACGQVRQHWVSVCIFPSGLHFGRARIEDRRKSNQIHRICTKAGVSI